METTRYDDEIDRLYITRPEFPIDCIYGIHFSYPPIDGVDVVITELISNPGTSITNNWEAVATWLYNEGHILAEPEKVRWFEHYEGRDYVDQVSMTFSPIDLSTGIFRNPQWRRAGIPPREIHYSLGF